MSILRRGILQCGNSISVDPVFVNNEWATIILACQLKIVPDTWVVGNYKNMSINGHDYRIDIIGKGHDSYSDGSGEAPLTFQMHDLYGVSTSDRKRMHSYGNSVGWANCEMRTTTLPSMLLLMPAEVQAGIKQVNKLTSAGNRSTSIVTTSDKLFLLSEVEVSGLTTWSYPGEGSRYAYYLSGGSKTKLNFEGNGGHWWERSPRKANTTDYCQIYTDGTDGRTSATSSMYLAPAFCF